jgi:hypothetical protein
MAKIVAQKELSRYAPCFLAGCSVFTSSDKFRYEIRVRMWVISLRDFGTVPAKRAPTPVEYTPPQKPGWKNVGSQPFQNANNHLEVNKPVYCTEANISSNLTGEPETRSILNSVFVALLSGSM